MKVCSSSVILSTNQSILLQQHVTSCKHAIQLMPLPEDYCKTETICITIIASSLLFCRLSFRFTK